MQMLNPTIKTIQNKFNKSPAAISLTDTNTNSLTNRGMISINLVFDQQALKDELKNMPRPDPKQSTLQIKRNYLSKFILNKYQTLKALKSYLAENDMLDSVNLRARENRNGTINYLAIECTPDTAEKLRAAIKKADSGFPKQITELALPPANFWNRAG